MIQTNNFFLKLFEGKDKFDYKVMNENWERLDDAVDELLNGGNGAVLPFMTAEKVDNGYRITITDAKGSQSFILPSYTLTDADKQEIADLADVGSDILAVTLTENDDGTYTSSHTPAEIRTAVLEGKQAFLFDGSSVYTVTFARDNYAYFDKPIRGGLTRCTISNNTAVIASIITESAKNPYALTIDGMTYDGSQAVDATSKIQEIVNAKIKYGTTEVTDGAASSYPEGTLYVVID